MLAEQHGFKVSRETVRKWMVEDGLWLSRKQRRTFHQPRLRRECFGELIQIDGSERRWFEDRGDLCTLLIFIDDATSTLMELRLVPSESTFSYFEAIESYLLKHDRPVAFYSDKHTVFRVAKPMEQKSLAAVSDLVRNISNEKENMQTSRFQGVTGFPTLFIVAGIGDTTPAPAARGAPVGPRCGALVDGTEGFFRCSQGICRPSLAR
jgi:hypothetical protein